MNSELTRHQKSILKMLETLDSPISAQELCAKLCSARKKIGLATVYRGLDILKLRGLIQCHTTINGVSLYSLANEYNHYLTCLRCGKSISIDFRAISELEAQLENSLSFTVFYHTLEFFGICNPCQVQNTILLN
jgi:Fur family ferric uptake transcriptional regulator